MYELEGELVVSPTDLTRFVACRHLTTLDLAAARAHRAPPPGTSEELEILFRRGLEHEGAFLARLREQGRQVTEIDVARFGPGRAGLQAAERATVEAMADRAGVIYQATFFDGAWRGHADFLLRRDDRGGRWGWSYDVADTKLSRRMAVPALLQMAGYAERLTELQGTPPELLVVVTGDGAERPYRYDECAAYARRLRARLLAFVADPPDTRPEPVSHCGQCHWNPRCRQQWQVEDHLHLVARLRSTQADTLRAAGISTLAALAAAAPHALPAGIGGPAAADRIVQQARLQVIERRTGAPAHRLLPPVDGRGLALLPEPSTGDVFFDIEGDPFVGERGLEYLFGVVHRGTFTAYWATHPDAEKAAFEALVDRLTAAWEQDPGMHVYHYASYEPSRLKALAGRYDTRIEAVDRLLRGQRLVDLYTVVKQGLQVGKESYSLKKLEDHYWGHGRAGAGVTDALGSVVAFERWLLDRSDALLEQICAYNEQDCRSTQALRDWLETLREAGGGDAVHARPVHGAGEPSDAVLEQAERSQRLRRALLAGLPDRAGAGAGAGAEAEADTAEQQGCRLLAGLLDWHRREALPEWSDHFGRRSMTDEELVDDPVALGALGGAEPLGAIRRSQRWRIGFPAQQTALAPGDDDWTDPATGERIGTVVDVRPEHGLLVVDRGAGRPPPRCTSLVPPGPVAATQLQARLAELAEWVIEHGLDSPSPGWRASRSLLLRRPPGGPGTGVRAPGESAVDAVLRATRELSGGVLPVQGPPGTGKTRTAAELVLGLLADGLRVGICAFSHNAVGALLAEVAEQARAQGVGLRALQRAEPAQACADPVIASTPRAELVEAGLATGDVTLAAGTPWLFARPGMQARLDVLVVDEAGQLSLANVTAIGASATSLVLFGDPRQLAQPIKGAHPPGAGVSALEHLLQGHRTVPPERGVLLDTTYRMHPSVAGFVSRLSYQGRLGWAPGLGRQAVGSAGPLGGSGLRWVPIEHHGNVTSSPQEAEAAAGLVEALLADGTWTDRHGVTRQLDPADLLLLTPYNQQVHRLRRALEQRIGSDLTDRIRVGTVDAMQGRQGAVVLYSLACSSAELAPRGVEFLYSLNRLTVALSRARGLVALLGSPDLLLSPVRSPAQLRRVDALCRFAEEAQTVRWHPGR